VRGNWLQRIRRIHAWLGVFFSPLLLLFIVTGWWQTFVSEDDKDKGFFNSTMSKFSSIHTDDYFPRSAGSHHASEHFKILVACMAVALILTILLGLALAFQTMKKFWRTALAFLLGILVPAIVLYFN
jgi:predicted permease